MNAARLIGAVKLFWHAHKSTIMVASGVAGAVSSTVIACVQTRKLPETMEKVQGEIQSAREEGGGKELAIAYAKGAGNMVRLYGIPALLEGVSIALIIGGHVGVRKEYNAICAAYTALARCYDRYRTETRKIAGEEVDDKIYFSRPEDSENSENSEAGVDKEYIEDNSCLSPCARMFDESNPNWSDDPDMNLMFLRNVQREMNNRLNAYGFVFLNDVYEALGMKRSGKGCVLGWIEKMGDGYIDFGKAYHRYCDAVLRGDIARDSKDPANAEILLDFNVYGAIPGLLDKMCDNWRIADWFVNAKKRQDMIDETLEADA